MSRSIQFAPFLAGPIEAKTRVVTLPENNNGISKVMRIASLALGLGGFAFYDRSNFETSPYDFGQVIKASETDSFVRQAFAKYRELIWKEGWDIVSENDEAVDYIQERIDYIELAMKKTFDDLLVEISDQLVKFGNCFLAKARGPLGPYFPGRINTPEDVEPIVGYYVVPAETMEIKRDKHNRPIRYRQRTDDRLNGLYSNKRQPSWSPKEMIHLSIDKKPGHAFGTPFMVSVIDDIVALRQMEEDIQNLIHKELFPLYKYSVGTPEHPAEPAEIDAAAAELQNLRSDGGLVLPDRHDVDVIGANSTALDASDYLRHFVTRVCTGLGLSPHHLGIMEESGNRAVTDRLDIALYDKVKTYQRYLSGVIRLNIFSEILFEGGFDPIVHPAVSGESDRCEFKFREIDVDTQVKKENHIIQKWASNLISLEEARTELAYDPEIDEDRLLMTLTAKIGLEYAPNPVANGGGSNNSPRKPDAQRPSSGGSANKKNTSKSTGNKSRPSNQHGRRTSPSIRHSETWLSEVVELLDDEDDAIISLEEMEVLEKGL